MDLVFFLKAVIKKVVDETPPILIRLATCISKQADTLTQNGFRNLGSDMSHGLWLTSPNLCSCPNCPSSALFPLSVCISHQCKKSASQVPSLHGNQSVGHKHFHCSLRSRNDHRMGRCCGGSRNFRHRRHK